METDCWMLPTTPKRAFHLICTVKEAQSLERLSNLLVITQLESTRAWIPAQETWFQNSPKICHIVNIQALPEAPRKSLPRLLGTIKAWLMMVVVARHSKVPCLLLLSSVTVAPQQSPQCVFRLQQAGPHLDPLPFSIYGIIWLSLILAVLARPLESLFLLFFTWAPTA